MTETLRAKLAAAEKERDFSCEMQSKLKSQVEMLQDKLAAAEQRVREAWLHGWERAIYSDGDRDEEIAAYLARGTDA